MHQSIARLRSIELRKIGLRSKRIMRNRLRGKNAVSISWRGAIIDYAWSIIILHFARGKSLLDARTRISERNVRGWPVRSLLLDSIPFARAHLQFLQLNRDCVKFSLEFSRQIDFRAAITANFFSRSLVARSILASSSFFRSMIWCIRMRDIANEPMFLQRTREKDQREIRIAHANANGRGNFAREAPFDAPLRENELLLDTHRWKQSSLISGRIRFPRSLSRLSKRVSLCSLPSRYIIRDFRIQEKKLRENASENEAIL